MAWVATSWSSIFSECSLAATLFGHLFGVIKKVGIYLPKQLCITQRTYASNPNLSKAAKLPEFPRLYRAGRVEGTREMVVWANYIVVYEEDPIMVRILRVLHGAQQWPPESP